MALAMRLWPGVAAVAERSTVLALAVVLAGAAAGRALMYDRLSQREPF
jgi:hypothetical protein